MGGSGNSTGATFAYGMKTVAAGGFGATFATFIQNALNAGWTTACLGMHGHVLLTVLGLAGIMGAFGVKADKARRQQLLDFADELNSLEIGRASCRERV